MNKILVVDDDHSFLELTKMMLAGDFEIDFASSAVEGLGKIKALDYDAAILDVSLPDYTGYYLGDQIRKIYPDMPLAFLTNYDGEVTKENAELIDALFWFKPHVVISKSDFISKVKGLIENGKKK